MMWCDGKMKLTLWFIKSSDLICTCQNCIKYQKEKAHMIKPTGIPTTICWVEIMCIVVYTICPISTMLLEGWH